MSRIGENHRIGHTLHHGLHLRDDGLHVHHAVVIMFHLEQPRQIAIGQIDDRAQFGDVGAGIRLAYFGHHHSGVSAHIADATDLVLQLQS